MRSTAVVIVAVVCLAAGFAGGYLLRDPGGPGGSVGPGGPGGEVPPAVSVLEDARAAVSDLMQYHGDGPRASVKVRRMIERIVAGGEAVLPDVEKALQNCGHHSYNVMAYSIDTRSVDIDLPPTRRTAFMVAADRIGGEGAVRILLAATRPTEVWYDHVTAYLLLARRAEHEDVQEAYKRAALTIVGARLNGPAVHRIIEIMCGRLPTSLAPKFQEAFRGGWLLPDTQDRVAEVLYFMDAEGAAEFFESVLGDTTLPKNVRALAARALARIPDHRPIAVALIARDPQPEIVGQYAYGLENRVRFGQIGMYQDIREYGTPEAIRKYNEENVKDFESGIETLADLEKRLDPNHPSMKAVKETKARFESFRKRALTAMEQVHRLRADPGGD